jgi:hypothetical protein
MADRMVPGLLTSAMASFLNMGERGETEFNQKD